MLQADTWPYGLDGDRRDVLALASCRQLNMLGRRHHVGSEPDMNIPEIVRRLPQEIVRRVAERLRKYNQVDQEA